MIFVSTGEMRPTVFYVNFRFHMFGLPVSTSQLGCAKMRTVLLTFLFNDVLSCYLQPNCVFYVVLEQQKVF